MWSIVDCKEAGRRIRQFRRDAGLSQEALAVLVGVSFQHSPPVSDWGTMFDF